MPTRSDQRWLKVARTVAERSLATCGSLHSRLMDAFVASVFGGPGATGNPTGVVHASEPLSHERMQEIAAKLGFPDTAFVWKTEAGFAARFYSPTEVLSVCYQALIAAAHAVGPASFELTDRALRVEVDGGLGWVHTPRDLIKRASNITTPSGLIRVIDAGRKRAYVRVDGDTFERFQLSPEGALAWLQKHQLSGLCLLHDTRLRVFTTSLQGREDIATGGAVAGLALLHEGRVSIEQGVGHANRRGVLELDGTDETIRVGGRCELLIRGQL